MKKNKKQKTKKCPNCKGTGKVKVDQDGLTEAENKQILKKFKEYV